MPDKANLARRIAPWSLMVIAVLWGSTFFSIKRLLLEMSATDFLAVRFLISTIVLMVVFHKSLKMSRQTWIRGLTLGVIWAAAQILQTEGLARTSASISGFVTGLYVVFTPIMGYVLYRLKLGKWTWIAVALATVGLAALTIHPSQSGTIIGLGEALTIGCSILFATHIAVLGQWSTPQEAMSLTIAQSISMTVIFWIVAAPNGVTVPHGTVNWIWMVYLAVFCAALPLLVQTWAQSYVAPTKAAVIMCSEPLWATFFAILFGGERPGWMFALGALAILGAMYLVIRTPSSGEPRRIEPSDSTQRPRR